MNDLVERMNTEELRQRPGAPDYVAGRRPRDAATLLVLDRSAGPVPRVLVGRRHERHVFMPGKFVFPGGRVDPEDSRVATAGGYAPDVAERLALRLPGRHGPARIHAFGVAAIRETYEETGVFIGTAAAGRPQRAPRDETWAAFAARGLAPSLAPLRFVARAITPPGRPRRFDTRFLAVWSDAVAARLDGPGPSGELEEVQWMPLGDAASLDMPTVTRVVIEELARRLAVDPELAGAGPVPFYRWHGRRFVREEI